MGLKTLLTTFVLIAAHVFGAASSRAENYPDRPVRFIIPFGVGGTNSFLTNVVGHALGAKWGVQVVTEARPGAGGNIGADAAARAVPDGYTLLWGTQGVAVNIAYLPKTAVNPLTALDPIVWIGSAEFVLLVKTSLPVNNVKELVDYAKARPGDLNYASLGTGSASLLAALLFNDMTGIKAETVPYNGASQAATDILGQRIDYWITTLGSALPNIQSGKVRALAVSGNQRAANLPEVPTFAEAGYGDFRAAAWYVLFAPVSTPKNIIDKLNADFNDILSQQDLKERFATVAVTPKGGTIDEAKNFVGEEITRWSGILGKMGQTEK